jgi:hypothetical protein
MLKLFSLHLKKLYYAALFIEYSCCFREKKNYLKSSLSCQLPNVLLTYFHFIKFIGLNSIRSSNNNNNLNSNI